MILKNRNFKRTKEDFICLNCGTEVEGNGYTNHCPQCLYSRHVDINPGDRRANCGGLMEPVDLETKNSQYVVSQRCQRCGFERRNKTATGDDFETILKLVAKIKY